jgi:hypothetical protein
VLLEKYKDDVFGKNKWYAYINCKKAETDLARNINPLLFTVAIWQQKL